MAWAGRLLKPGPSHPDSHRSVSLALSAGHSFRWFPSSIQSAAGRFRSCCRTRHTTLHV